MKTAEQKIVAIEKTLKTFRKSRELVAASKLDGVPVDIMDCARIVADIDAIILSLENRIAAIGRRAA